MTTFQLILMHIVIIATVFMFSVVVGTLAMYRRSE